ncbi:hypothetical protein [Paraburkholderia xenovorans]|nr:hypothetical protein [Paraburkholderia xenovorans]NPT36237.1 hypothetical protein [Paraburkholderia xenovorans]
MKKDGDLDARLENWAKAQRYGSGGQLRGALVDWLMHWGIPFTVVM